MSEDVGALVVVVIFVVVFGLGFVVGWPCPRCWRLRAMDATGQVRSNDDGGYDQFERRCRFCGYTDWKDDLPIE